jgi:hypothetical protein
MAEGGAQRAKSRNRECELADGTSPPIRIGGCAGASKNLLTPGGRCLSQRLPLQPFLKIVGIHLFDFFV